MSCSTEGKRRRRCVAKLAEGGKHISKVLLELFSPPGDPMAAYRKYLGETLNFNLSHAFLAGVPDDILGKFYQLDEPPLCPKYFNFFKPRDLSRLENCLRWRIVVLREEGAKRPVQKVHDRRIFGGDNWVGTRFFTLSRNNGLFNLEERASDYEPRSTESYFISKCSQTAGCLLEVLSDFFPAAKSHTHSDLCRNFNVFCCRGDLIHQECGGGPPFALVSHVRTEVRMKVSWTPKDQTFAILCVAAPRGEKPDPAGLRVLALTRDLRHVYEVQKDQADAIRTISRRQRGFHKESYPSLGSGEQVDRYGDFQTTILDNGSDGCDCDPCRDSGSFKKNLSADGPQKLYRSDISTFDHLKLFGLFTPALEEAVLTCCDLSIASFDTEALTIAVDDEAGNEDLGWKTDTVSSLKTPRVVTARQVPIMLSWTDQLGAMGGVPPVVFDFDKTKPLAMVENFVESLLERRAAAEAEKRRLLAPLFEWLAPLREAHFDFHMGRTGEVPVADDDEEAATEEAGPEDCDDKEGSGSDEEAEVAERARLLRRSEFIADQQRIATLKKERRLGIAWKHSPMGLFETQIERLATCFLVFGFNAEAYDLVILCSMLCSYLKKKTGRSRVSMQREGSKIKRMSFHGIQILEAKRLLAPGFSLDSFARLCGLEETKGIFPFALLTSEDFLKRARLPSDSAEWKSDLGKSPTQDQVDAALAEFDAAGFVSVGEYLTHYLRLDVTLLQKSMLVLNRALHRTLGLSFVDSRKYTISSLSTAASQAELMRGKRIGSFSPNHTRIYSVSCQSDAATPPTNAPPRRYSRPGCAAGSPW
jgi:hypothetical protein